MPLNSSQASAFTDVINFINSDEKFMSVSGGAGTGKTFFIIEMVTNILKYAKKGSPLTNVAVTATTNKAVAVINQSLPKHSPPATTIYSFMNLRVHQDFSSGEQKVIPTKTWGIHSNTLIIVDECSMINTNLFDYLCKGTDSTCKIIFVGDKNQLAPVKETLSPIYKTKMPMSYLTVPVRNAGSQDLMDLCEQAKQTVLTGKFTPIVPVPGVIDVVDGVTCRGMIERIFFQESTDLRILSYTNSRVVDYNSFVRTLRGYKEPFEVGEIVTNNESIELPGKTRLYTDQVLKILYASEPRQDETIIKGYKIPMIRIEAEDFVTKQVHVFDVFAEPQDRRDALNYYKSRKNWGKFYGIKNKIPDLRPTAASTTHKAQGSTFDSVVVDMADIGSSTNKDQTARMQYVALSRPKSRLIIRGQLPERYFD